MKISGFEMSHATRQLFLSGQEIILIHSTQIEMSLAK